MKGIVERPGASARKSALKIAVIYAAIGFVWILFSDLAVEWVFSSNTRAVYLVQTAKGWFFITSTAVVIYLLTQAAISVIQKSEGALRENQRVLFTLFDNLPGMAYRCRGDIECTLEFVSRGAESLTGYSPDELTDRKKIDHLIVEEDREAVRSATEKALEEKSSFRAVYRIRRVDGETRWAWEQGRGIYSPAGELVAIEGFISDITERKRAEEALVRSEKVYKALIEGTSDAILMVDRDRTIVSVNRAFAELFGYSKDELEGHSARIIHPSDESFNGFDKMAYPVIEAKPIRFEWHLKSRDGKVFPVEGTYSAIKGPDGSISGHVGIIRDISERKKTERELEEYREHLEEMVRNRTRELEEAHRALVQEEKLKTLGAIAAEVAHGIRNPLVSIGGFARRLQKKYPDSQEALIILQESRRLETMLNRITNYLRPIQMKSQECYVNSIISESLDLLAPELERERVSVRLDLDPGLPRAHVDPDILAQVFVAIIRNAVSMMDSTRELSVRTYDSEQSIFVNFQNPVAKNVKDPELMLLPFDPDEQVTGVSSSFKLLKGMGGALTFSEADRKAAYTVSLVKCRGAVPDQAEEHEGM